MFQLPGIPSLTQALLSLLMGKDIWVLHLVIEIILQLMFVISKVQARWNEVKCLTEIANLFPRAAYVDGLFGR